MCNHYRGSWCRGKRSPVSICIGNSTDIYIFISLFLLSDVWTSFCLYICTFVLSNYSSHNYDSYLILARYSTMLSTFCFYLRNTESAKAPQIMLLFHLLSLYQDNIFPLFLVRQLISSFFPTSALSMIQMIRIVEHIQI